MSESERNALRYALKAFIDWNVYNGAPGKGQALANAGGNPWLHEQIEWFLEKYPERFGSVR